MPSRRHGEGWVEPRGARFRARYWVDGKKQTIGTFDTLKEADGALAAFVDRLGLVSPVAGETLEEWSRRWLNAREEDGVHRSVSKDRHAFKRVTRRPIASLALLSVTPRDVRDWVAEQVREKAARQTIANALNLLRVCLESACETGRLQVNPALGVKVPRIASTKEKWTWLRPVEVAALLREPGETRDVFACAIYTGVRAGELFGLEWRDVDLEHGTASIRHSWKGKPTKRGEARRITLLEPVVEALRRQLERSKGRRHVFPARDGAGRSMDQMPSLAAALRAVGIARHVRFHDLRHTCASLLLQGAWAPAWIARPLRLEEVKEWLGHTSIATTQRYAHLCPEGLSGLVVRAPKLAPKRPQVRKVRER